jgi:hypothetical protein
MEEGKGERKKGMGEVGIDRAEEEINGRGASEGGKEKEGKKGEGGW